MNFRTEIPLVSWYDFFLQLESLALHYSLKFASLGGLLVELLQVSGTFVSSSVLGKNTLVLFLCTDALESEVIYMPCKPPKW